MRDRDDIILQPFQVLSKITFHDNLLYKCNIYYWPRVNFLSILPLSEIDISSITFYFSLQITIYFRKLNAYFFAQGMWSQRIYTLDHVTWIVVLSLKCELN